MASFPFEIDKRHSEELGSDGKPKSVSEVWIDKKVDTRFASASGRGALLCVEHTLLG